MSGTADVSDRKETYFRNSNELLLIVGVLGP